MIKGSIDIFVLNRYRFFHAFDCMMEGLRLAAGRAGYEVNVITDNEMDIDGYIDSRKNKHNCLLVLMGFNITRRCYMIDRLDQERICFAVANKYLANMREVNAVSIDHINAAEDVVMHLLVAAQRRKIACVGFDRLSFVDMDKLEGCKNAHRLVGMELTEDNIYYSEHGSAVDTVDIFLKQAKEYDGVFCATDCIAIVLIKRAAAAGIKIPDDLALVGFDGIYAGKYLKPSLTTVTVNFNEVGLNIVKMASVLQENPTIKSMKIVCDHKLIVRQSCGMENSCCLKPEKAIPGYPYDFTAEMEEHQKQIYSDSTFEVIEMLDRIFTRPDPFEMKVLRMLLEGLYYKEISARLSIGERSIKYHVKRLMEQAGIKNRSILSSLMKDYLDASMINWDSFNERLE